MVLEKNTVLSKLKNIVFGPMHPTRAVIVGVFLFFLIVPLIAFISFIRPAKILSDINPGSFGIEYESVSFLTEDGVQIRGWFIQSEIETKKTIIALHGYPADKGDIMPFMTHLLSDFNLLLFDFRYLGESSGRVSTAGLREVKDLRAAIEFLKEREVDEIGLWGFSVGGAVALQEASRHSEVKAVFSDSSYARLDLLSSDLYRIPFLDKPLGAVTVLWARILLRENIRENSPEYRVADLEVPALITHSRNDDVIPFAHALILQEALGDNEKAEFWFRESGPHGMMTEEYKQKMRGFFMDNL